MTLLARAARLFFLAAFVLFWPLDVCAQVPSAAEPSRVQEQFAPKKTPLLIQPKITVPETSGAHEAPPGAEEIKFQLTDIVIEGSNVYTKEELQAFYKDKIGTTVSLADVFTLASRITARYRNDGYILSRILVPPQTIETGAVQLKAVEGFIDKISIEGKATPHLQRLTQKLAGQKPLNSKDLERALLLMNDLPGMTARAVLSPSATVTDASNLTIITEQKFFGFTFQADNRGTRYSGPLQANASATLQSPFGFHDAITVQAARAPDESEMGYFSLGYSLPLGRNGTRLSLGTNTAATRPGYTLSPFAIKGLSRSWHVEVSHPFVRSRHENVMAALRFDYQDSARKDNISAEPTEDRLRVLRLSGTYQFSDRFAGLNTFTMEGSRGFDIFNSTQSGSDNLTRERGRSDFTKLTAEISRLQPLAPSIDLLASLSGQKSSHILLASEEFGLGGLKYGGAYDSSEITGENGLAARMELRYSGTAPSFRLDNYQFYGYYDVGRVWSPDGSTADERRASLASSGLGVRLGFLSRFFASLEAALPLTRPVGTEDNGKYRVFAALGSRL